MKILHTYENLSYELSESQVQIIQTESKLGKPGGIWIGSDYISFSSIRSITDSKDEKAMYPELPGQGFDGVMTQARRLKCLESLAKGIKKSIAARKKLKMESPNAEQLLHSARSRYKLVKTT